MPYRFLTSANFSKCSVNVIIQIDTECFIFDRWYLIDDFITFLFYFSIHFYLNMGNMLQS
jgi:hypothetical protein